MMEDKCLTGSWGTNLRGYPSYSIYRLFQWLTYSFQRLTSVKVGILCDKDEPSASIITHNSFKRCATISCSGKDLYQDHL